MDDIGNKGALLALAMAAGMCLSARADGAAQRGPLSSEAAAPVRQADGPARSAVVVSNDMMAAHRPFLPRVAPKSSACAKLRILPGKNMAFVTAALDGRECNLLFDTGATHTTFDVGFLNRELPGKKLGEVKLAGVTNVEGMPKIFHVDSLKIGEAEFRDFHAMALDVSHLAQGIGARVDGILGMNVIGCVPALVSFGSGKVVFSPGDADCAGFGGGIARFRGDPMSVAMVPVLNGKKFGLIVDSASSLTFLDKSLGWPSSGESVAMGAVDVNGGSSLAAEKGAAGKLGLGTDVEIAPLLVGGPVNRIGADALLAYDMLLDFAQVKFRRCAAPRSAGAPCQSGGKENAEGRKK